MGAQGRDPRRERARIHRSGAMTPACEGIPPLRARLEPWQQALLGDPGTLEAWLGAHGSPLNVLHAGPFGPNALELRQAAARHGLELRIQFARKANKAIAFVDEARRIGAGVDVASERELRQVLERGVEGRDAIVTAAVKPAGLLELAVACGAVIVLDNGDELDRLDAIALGTPAPVPVALRLAPVLPDRAPSRFGMPAAEIVARAATGDFGAAGRLRLEGIHFHLDGYAAGDRAIALRQSLALIDELRRLGHAPSFVDMGGGVPMRYLEDAAQWAAFWGAEQEARAGRRAPLTYDGHELGRVYPAWQALTGGAWLDRVLGSSTPEGTVAEAIRARGLELRCEPGRALLDGCGITVARVEFRKRRADGVALIGLAMNRTQHRSAADDQLVDPILVRPPGAGSPGPPTDAFLVGAYCIEQELIGWRRLRFASGVAVGDLIVFPNSAGYLMHVVESASHQLPLARNVVLGTDGEAGLDPIDAEALAAAIT
jgi:diaminopimelate decarboxylase